VKRYSLSHLSDDALSHGLDAVIARDRMGTAEMLAHIAEFDARRLYLPAGYSSMYAYCVGRLHFSEEAAFKRIHAARAARRFPAIFAAVADGRLHLSAVVMLAPHLLEETAKELLEAATHKTKAEIEKMLAERFPRPDLPTLVQAVPLSPAAQHAPGRVGEEQPPTPRPEAQATQHAPGRVDPRPDAALAPPCPEAHSRVRPLAPQRYGVQFTMSQSAHDKLRHVQELLGHQVPSGDIARIFEMAMDAWIPMLERRKFAATAKPRPSRGRGVSNPRYVPAQLRRAVWERDGGRCTFVSESGHRCEARKPLEFDHALEVARGGEPTLEGIRLRCRAHNQYQAERTFGADFMRHKRIAATEATG